MFSNRPAKRKRPARREEEPSEKTTPTPEQEQANPPISHDGFAATTPPRPGEGRADLELKCEVKSLYTHSSGSNHAWSEFRLPKMEEMRLKAISGPYAIVHRFARQDNNDDAATWVTHSIEVQSPRLRAVLDVAFEDYPNWNSDLEPYRFYPQFRQFFHLRHKLEVLVDQQTSDATEAELKLFLRVLSPLLEPHLRTFENFATSRTITFHNLWLILAPGELVVTHIDGSLCVCKLGEMQYCRDPCGEFLSVKMEQLSWNGSYSGFITVIGVIREFEGSQLVTKLCVYPLKFAVDEKEIRRKLLARGRKFADLRGFHVQHCEGKKVVKDNIKPVSGRVIVDAYAFHICQDEVAPALSRSSDQKVGAVLAGLTGYYEKTTPASLERKEEIYTMTDDEYILATPRVKGFDLKTKEWCEFYVEDLRDPDWNEDAYDKLVLPDEEKSMIMAFADRSRPRRRVFDDFMQNKGRGIVILLAGSPGVGKTLTAEAVADKCKNPLYILSADDMGTSPEKMDRALENAFRSCYLWDALLLLDEADVFMEKRGSDSLNRNELVSIFLRRLEYYQGLMFLTTNRTAAIDEAFKSRMDLIVRYPGLDKEARRRIWENFFSLLPTGTYEISSSDLDKLVENELNGREIKNLIKTALILVPLEEPLTVSHLQTVISIRQRAED